MTDYGLPTPRKDGELQPDDHTYEWSGQEVTIRMVPPTITQQDEYETLGEDVSIDELAEIVERHVVEPDVSEIELTTRELFCYLEGIISYGMSDTGMAAAVREELEAREETGGN